MIEINNRNTIYIACLSNFATGGTELLHQLCFKLNLRKIKAVMYYYDHINFKSSPVNDRFKQYNVPHCISLNDNQDNILIIPEIATHLICSFPNSVKVVWWLSVDNYMHVKSSLSRMFFIKRSIKAMLKRQINSAIHFLSFSERKILQDDRIIHFVQSYYAHQFLMEKLVPKNRIYFLSDYLNSIFFEDLNFETKQNQRRNCVLYNPLKGIDNTEKIMKVDENIEFIPITGKTVDEVKFLLRTSKIYIDFGNHPGKDRIPREAVISGAVLITNLKGSAAFFDDVPIDSKYKFTETVGFEYDVVKLINEIFANFEYHISKFSDYRKRIQNEEAKFEEDLMRIFKVK